MAVHPNTVKARPAWKTFLVELLSVRAGFYLSQKTHDQPNKRDHLG